MPITEHVEITITADSAGLARAGFGVPAFLTYNAPAGFTERVRFYASLAEVAVDFPVTTGPEYLAAQAAFSQSPHPSRIAFLRGALPATQRYLLEVAAVTHLRVYSVKMKGDGVTSTTATYTADAATTNDEIIDGLVLAINGVTGKNFTATTTGSVGSLDILITGNAAGEWFSAEVVDVTALKIAQNHADPGVATDLGACLLETSEWYALATFYNSEAYVKAAAAWVESNGRIYLPDTNETDSITVASDGTQGLLDDLKTLAYNRTMGAYHPSPAAMLPAGWYGRVLPIDAGSESWKGKTLAGIETTRLTSTHKTNLRARKANWYETVGTLNMTMEGTIGGSFAFLDVTRGRDWVEDDMAKGLLEAIAQNDKVPMDNPGLAILEGKMRKTLRQAVTRKIARAGTIVLTIPDVDDIPSADRAVRTASGLKFSFILAGAIHKVKVNGTVSV